MLRIRHIDLNRPPSPDDITQDMSTHLHNTYDRPAGQAAKFAHELANLLDGSMRNVSLVRSMLSGPSGERTVASEEKDLLARLQTAEQGMKQMATLLKGWLAENHQTVAVSSGSQTLSDVLFEARALHAPAAQAIGIDINIHVTGSAARIPAGPVFSIIANALRNSIEAIATDQDRSNRRAVETGLIEIRAQVQNGQVRISIADNGPGLPRELFDTAGIFRFNGTTKTDGHGLGLALSRDIATSLGGTLRVTNLDEGGALVTLTYASEKTIKAGQK